MLAATPPAIETTSLGRRYGRRWALMDLTFEIPRGSTAMLIGHNGSGKSTLLRVLATALRPDQGHARIHGYDVSQARVQAQHTVALLGHHLYLYDALSALENLQLVARFLGAPSQRPELLERLAQVGLAQRADDPVASFSAGMRKRLALARTLQQPAQVVLLDEPYGELDPAGFRWVDDLLSRLRGEGRTVLMATHLVERGRALCDFAVALEAGRLAYAGPAAQAPGAGA